MRSFKQIHEGVDKRVAKFKKESGVYPEPKDSNYPNETIFVFKDGSSLRIYDDKNRMDYFGKDMKLITSYTTINQAIKAIDQSGLFESYDIHEGIEINEGTIKFSDDQLEQLRKGYGKIDTIDPESPVYKKLRKFLDGLDVEALKQIRDAKIKFLSITASTILMFKHKIKD